MSDRELLEMAAKAAGAHFAGLDKDGMPLIAWGNAFYPWSPLTSDGDAMRLAVQLNIDVICHRTKTICRLKRKSGLLVDAKTEVHSDAGCPHAATRRAIVRAAAEIGKSKEMK
jgi:hypothetical protein